MITVNYPLVKEFLLNLVSGLGALIIYAALIISGGAAGIYITASLLTQLSGLTNIIFALLSIPLLGGAWYISYYLSFEFLNDIGIKLEGSYRYLIIPIALPLGFLSFIFSLIASVGQSINNKGIRTAAFLVSITLFLLIIFYANR